MLGSRVRWGDAVDEEYDDAIPPPSTSGPDANGIQTHVEYRRGEGGGLIKTTTRVRSGLMEKRVYKVSAQRKAWKRFGAAEREQEGDTITVQAAEEIPFERSRPLRQTQEEKKAADVKKALQGQDKNAIVGSLGDLLYRKRMERQLAAARGEAPMGHKPPDEDVPEGGFVAGAAPKAGGYVPPNRRAGAGGDSGVSEFRRRDENSVRVTNLSEDTHEDDLRELFSPFGALSRVYIAKDRDTGIARGFAFVNFVNADDAQRAIAKMDGYGYDSLILRVEMAQPRAERQ